MTQKEKIVFGFFLALVFLELGGMFALMFIKTFCGIEIPSVGEFLLVANLIIIVGSFIGYVAVQIWDE